MSEPAPLQFQWDGEVMRPLRARIADREYVVGEIYRLGIIEERSAASHSHYFAALHEAFVNLPDREAERFPSVDHLRRYALIKTGFYDSETLTCSSKAEAQRIASFVRPREEFALVVVKDATVTRYVAKSQNYRSMNRQEFNDSKQKVLDYVASLIGVARKALSDNVGVSV